MPDKNRSWIKKIVGSFSHEPQDREDLMEVLHEAEDRHLINSESLDMIEGVIHVSEMQVRDIMIPRAQMVILGEDFSLEQIIPIIVESGHSRFPVTDEDRENIIGLLLAKDLLAFYFSKQDEAFDLKKLIRPVTFIPESKRLDVLLKEFRDKHSHMAVVVNEYGGIAGLVTIEDVLEQIVGDIEDEYDIDDEQSMIQKTRDNEYNLMAQTPIEYFNEHFKTQLSTDRYDTIGGLLLEKFGHLPKRGEELQIQNLHFKILSSDHRRIKLIKLIIQASDQV